MRNYVLYIRKCPGVIDPRHFKIGVAALDKVRVRLASYQQAVGPVWKEEFLRIWVGEDIDVKEAEKKVKYNFKHKISSAEAGLSEWICDIEMETILDFVQELRDDYFIKLVDPPIDFQPLSMPLSEDLQEWYVNFVDNK